jgi:hypothetical protein
MVMCQLMTVGTQDDAGDLMGSMIISNPMDVSLMGYEVFRHIAQDLPGFLENLHKAFLGCAPNYSSLVNDDHGHT